MRRDLGGPSGTEGHDKAIAVAWEKFLSGDGMPGDAVRRMVEDSWRRCRDLGVNPGRGRAPLAVTEDGLHGLKERHRDLIRSARPVMAQARELLAESQTLMALTDPDGVILWVEGDPKAKSKSEDIKLVPGASWGESVSGTNAIGTALAAAQPVQIRSEEHFCEGIKHWTCSATVIRDPYDGALLGVLDISGLSGSHNTHCMALAVAGASRIENRLASLEMERRGRLLDSTLAHGRLWADRGVVLFDHRGRMVRANDRAEAYINALGLDMGAINRLVLPEGAPPDKDLPDWMRSDWLEPVMERNERLGTILALPRKGEPLRGKALSPSLASSPSEGDPFAAIIGESEPLRAVKARARRLARLPVPVLLLGPTGAGKEVFARALHKAGPRAPSPFVPLNCGAMTRDLLASELFGYVEGAFTGARRGGMAGKFEAADGGTLFLDEIGEMPPDLQAHFLRVLEDGVVYRLGDNKPRQVAVRVVAATNRDLRAEVAAGTFRMDLFYRLAVTVLHLPPLGDHGEDIPLLVDHFIEQTVRTHGLSCKRARPELLDRLRAYAWPGNVRELRNVVEGLVCMAEGDWLEVEDLPPGFGAPPPTMDRYNPGPGPIRLAWEEERGRALADREREGMIEAIALEAGNLTRAATRLGIAKSTLYEKMKRHGIDRMTAFKAYRDR
ncbi:sigma-54-dependent Fis family transcriptional regulator [Rhodospirillum sp. A1_3_36]|uniref:sigma-54-dependent Fis family transcriptional regulator n=1 Tax=Rhodospirillum sp. A1_3_36 TaxID=3391666 RepID=UPI0039A5F404